MPCNKGDKIILEASPLVSIVIPAYNHEKFVEECIRSIYSQTYANFELFVIDDSSTDGTFRILKDLQTEFGFYLEIRKNLGLIANFNYCLKNLVKGEYFTFCASDDYWLKNKVRSQVEHLLAHPADAMVYGKAYIVDEENKIRTKATDEANRNLKGGHIFNELLKQDFHPPVNYMIRTEILHRIGGYDENVWAEDFDMNVRLAYHYPIGFIDKFISCYRSGVNGKNKMLTYKTVNSHLRTIEKFRGTPVYHDALGLHYFRCFSWYCGYKESKAFALQSAFRSASFAGSVEYWYYVLILIFRWK